MLFLVTFISLVTVRAIVVPERKECPQVISVDNFDIHKYGTGKLYEIGRYPEDVMEKKGDCAVGDYVLHGDTAHFEITSVNNKKRVLFDGQARYDNDTQELIYTHYENDKLVAEVKSTVINTDYKNFYMLYNCKYDDTKEERKELFWILSRSPKPKLDIQTKMLNFLKSSTFININNIVWDHFTDKFCEFDTK